MCFSSRCQFNDSCQRFIAICGCVGTERDDGFTCKIITFRKSAYNHRCCPPPYGTADKNCIIFSPRFVFNDRIYGWTSITVTFCQCYFRTFSVIFRVRCDRLYTKQIRSSVRHYLLRHSLCSTSPTKICHKNVAVSSRCIWIIWIVWIICRITRCFGLFCSWFFRHGVIIPASVESESGKCHHQVN